jgi:PPM family protein phosphatase
MLTEDHTLVQRMVREGKLSLQEAEVHPQRSILTRALGVDDDVEVDDFTLELSDGDRIVLCTDGLTSMLGEDRIASILRERADPQSAADALVDAANEAGGQDNITVVIIDVSGADGDPKAATGTVDARGGAATEVLSEPEADDGATPPPAKSPSATTAPGAEDTGVVRVQDTPPRGEPEDTSSWRGDDGADRPVRRWLTWLLVAVVILGALAVGAKVYIDRQWFVGVADGRVAVFRGLPSDVLGLDLSTLVRTTDLQAAEAEEITEWAGLGDGIAVGDEEEANQVVEQIAADVDRAREGRKPGPGASPSVSPSPSRSG